MAWLKTSITPLRQRDGFRARAGDHGITCRCRHLIKLLSDLDQPRAKRVLDALMQMKKIDLATLKQAAA